MRSPMMRPKVSVGPPAGNGTTSVIECEGYGSAPATRASDRTARRARTKVRVTMRYSIGGIRGTRRRTAGRLAGIATRRKTMALTLTSSSFTEGATLGLDQILSADYGFGCGGGNKSPQLS